MASSIQLSSIPTISDLYKRADLEHSAEEPLYTPSAVLNAKVSLMRADITKLATTCIVNAANESLLGGGGVDGAIHAAAGASLYEECLTLNGCPTGSAKISGAHDLPSQHIIHAVGPVYHKVKRVDGPDGPAGRLTGCYRTSLNLAGGLERSGTSIAFSCLSTGVYGYPSWEAAEVASKCVRDWLEEQTRKGEGEQWVERVIFCCFLEKDVRAYEGWLPRIFPPTEAEAPKEAAAEQQITDSGISPTPASTTTAATNTEPATKKQKITPRSSQNLADDDKDWEAVEKPSLACSTMETASEADVRSEAGGHNLAESTDAVNIDAAAAADAAKEEMESKEPGITMEGGLEEDEGVKVEKPSGLEEDEGVEVEKPRGIQVENRLGKDW